MSAVERPREARGLYLSFPPSLALSLRSSSADLYAEAVLREAERRAADGGEGGAFVAWMAGGEPWRLGDRSLSSLFRELARFFPPAPRVERSIEWFVGEAVPERLVPLHESGFDRICLTGKTRAVGYRPVGDAAGLREAVRAARAAGFRRVALDMDPAGGAAGSIGPAVAAAAGPDHVSLVETPDESFPEERWIADYEKSLRILEGAGLLRYEVALFAKPGCRSVGLGLIAAGGSRVGLGAGAVSAGAREITRNEPDPDRYARIVGEGGDPVVLRDPRKEEDRLRERVFHGVRRIGGIHVGALERRFGAMRTRDLERRALPLFRAGLLRRAGSRLVPTDAGLLTAEGVARELLGEGV
ncbi:MAG: hypothetical protein JW958_10780 [Candidatus Eisenbacteria bacterium]|nr:hypothetical protein [Candidatus Eisenbacteria bacterium]